MVDPDKDIASGKVPSFASRRNLLKVIGGTSVAAFAGCLGDDDDDDADDTAPADDDDDADDADDGDDTDPADHDPIGNWPIEDDEAVFGLNAPLTGILAPDGEDQERGFELAIEHLNNGGGAVDYIDDLSGDGVLDYEIDYVISDSAGDDAASIENVERMADRDNIQFWTGGVSSGVCEALQPVAQRERVPYITSIPAADPITGENCVRYHFRSNMMADQMTRAIGQNAEEVIGEDMDYFIIYQDYSYGHSNRDGYRRHLPDSWEEVGSAGIAFGETDHTSQIADADAADPDVICVVSFGDALAALMSQVRDAGMDQQIVIAGTTPFSHETAGSASEGAIGTIDWNSQIDTDANNAFVEAYEDEYGQAPTYAAACVYDDTLQYAAAVEQTGTFHPPSVIRTLEEYSWDYMRGARQYRECDHQAEVPVSLVRGIDPDDVDETGEVLELITVGEPYVYDCDEEPGASCEMPEYGDE